ncbi:MAG: hypothetical protein PPP58_04035 [Natronomonas sp.]
MRASRTGASVDGIIETVRRYERQGVVDECAIESWPAETKLTEAAETVHSRYDQFRTWGEKTSVTLEPAFTRRERTTIVSEDSETVFLLPVLCLAVHIDGELVVVAPHHTETTTYTVEDALSDVESIPRSRLEDGSPFSTVYYTTNEEGPIER